MVRGACAVTARQVGVQDAFSDGWKSRIMATAQLAATSEAEGKFPAIPGIMRVTGSWTEGSGIKIDGNSGRDTGQFTQALLECAAASCWGVTGRRGAHDFG